MAYQRIDLILVSLSEEQIEKAKEANGRRKRITHALLCGPFGQMFGTEKQCLKYYEAWRQIFPELFRQAYRLDSYSDLNDFKTTFDLVNILIKNAEKRSKVRQPIVVRPSRSKPINTGAGCFGVLLAALISTAFLATLASQLAESGF